MQGWSSFFSVWLAWDRFLSLVLAYGLKACSTYRENNMDDGFKNLAANIFLDMVDGKFHDKSQVRTMASEAWAYAEVFASAEPKTAIKTNAMGLSVVAAAPEQAMIGCRACYGSGGKKMRPCKVCNGTGKVSQQEGAAK